MNTAFWILVCALLLGIIGIWFAYRFYKKRVANKKRQWEVTQEIMDVFDEAEKRMKGGIKEDGTTESPYQILWDLAKERQNRINRNKEVERTEQTTNNGKLSKQFDRGEGIQSRVTTTNSEDKFKPRKPKPNNFRRAIQRIRGRS